MWDRRTAEGEEGGHAAQRVAAVPRGDLEGLVDVVDREGHAVYADLVRARGSVSIVSGWMYSKTSRRPLPSGVWRLEHGDLGVVAVEADGCVGPLSTDSVSRGR
jgi:hypothetical protein